MCNSKMHIAHDDIPNLVARRYALGQDLWLPHEPISDKFLVTKYTPGLSRLDTLARSASRAFTVRRLAPIAPSKLQPTVQHVPGLICFSYSTLRVHKVHRRDGTRGYIQTHPAELECQSVRIQQVYRFTIVCLCSPTELQQDTSGKYA